MANATAARKLILYRNSVIRIARLLTQRNEEALVLAIKIGEHGILPCREQVYSRFHVATQVSKPLTGQEEVTCPLVSQLGHQRRAGEVHRRLIADSPARIHERERSCRRAIRLGDDVLSLEI